MKKELIRWKVSPIAGFCHLVYIQAMAWQHKLRQFLKIKDKIIIIRRKPS